MSDSDSGAIDGPTDPAPEVEEPAAARATAQVDDDWDDDWDDEAPRSGKRDMTVVYAIVAAALVIVIAVVLTRPKGDDTASPSGGGTTEETVRDLQWQGPVGEAVGDMDARISSETGVFIWTDFEGWHVRSTMGDPVTVDVTADTIVLKDAEGNSSGETKAEVSETIAPGDPNVGLDLDLGFSSNASFTVTVNGTPVPANEIKLGGGSGQADANPVTFTKA